MSRSLWDDLTDPNLFESHEQGHYEYGTNGVGGREASGYLGISDEPQRDPSAQLAAGGESRREAGNEWGVDDGGHLIGARFGGSPGEENLTAQDRNLNRGSFKRMENDWAEHIESGDKVFAHMETSPGDRPDAYMGYAIVEHPDGTRDYETYSFTNESRAQQEQWNQELEALDALDAAPAAGQAELDEGAGAGEAPTSDVEQDAGLEDGGIDMDDDGMDME